MRKIWLFHRDRVTRRCEVYVDAGEITSISYEVCDLYKGWGIDEKKEKYDGQCLFTSRIRAFVYFVLTYICNRKKVRQNNNFVEISMKKLDSGLERHLWNRDVSCVARENFMSALAMKHYRSEHLLKNSFFVNSSLWMFLLYFILK